MQTGEVKWLNPRGYGFISVPDGEDVFIHHTAFAKATPLIKTGDLVSFNTTEGVRGPSAINVQKLQ